MTDVSGDGMKILGTPPVHIGMRRVLLLSVGESAKPIQCPCAYVRWIRNQEFGVKSGPIEPVVMAQLHDLLSARRAHQPRNRLRENYIGTLELQWSALVAQQENAHIS